MPHHDEPRCVLRTQTLCDGSQLASVRCAPGQTEGCFCKRIRYLEAMGQVEAARELRTDRARTVARSSEVQRTHQRHAQLLQLGVSVPPF